MLCRLQSQIEAEELKWRNKLKEKEIEIEKLNEVSSSYFLTTSLN